MNLRILLREIVAIIKASAVPSSVQVAMAASLCLGVLLTLGQSVAAQQSVLGTLDDEGTRLITIRSLSTESGLNTSALSRIRRLDSVQAVIGFAEAVDATDPARPGAAPVGVRWAWGDVQVLQAATPGAGVLAEAGASETSLVAAGLVDGVGTLQLGDGQEVTVRGGLAVPPYLQNLEPLLIVPSTDRGQQALGTIVVIVKDAAAVEAATEALPALLGVTERRDVRVTASSALAALRANIESGLSTSARIMVLTSFVIMAGLVTVTTFAQVRSRRREFGRRRALGATRSFVLLLVWGQATLLATVGAGMGVVAAHAALLIRGDAMPGTTFGVALVVLTTAFVSFAGLLPAAAAARRDPVRELRVP